MRPALRTSLLSIPLALALWPAAASARATLDVSLPLERAFSAALRFVRVDRGCTVTDKDADAAFVVFECGETKKSRGTIELFHQGDGQSDSKRDGKRGDGRTLRIQVALPDEPHYAELRFLELFERKLKEDYGSIAPAPVRPKNPPPSAPPDGGTQ